MEFWRDNFIGHMPGPTFLLFYAAIILAAVIWVRWRALASDSTVDDSAEPPPENVNPLELAWLRGGEAEVLRFTLVSLVQRGYLRLQESKFLGLTTSQKIAQVTRSPGAQYLDPLEHNVFAFFASPQIATAMFENARLKDYAHLHCREIEARFDGWKLLTPAAVKSAAHRRRLNSMGVIAGLGALKLVIALSKGKTNVGLLIAFGFIGLVVIAIAGSPKRISSRGRAYIEQLQARHAGLKSRISSASGAVDDAAFTFALALFGMEVLQGTPYAALATSFRNAASGYGCGGGGCGGGGCGGGGCGGGCGGCGG